MLSDVGGFLGRNAPSMGQAPLHLALGGHLAIPGPAATPAWLGCASWLLLGHGVHQDSVHVAAGGQLVEPVNRQQRPLPAALAWLGDLNGHVLLALGSSPISSGRTSRVIGPWY